MVPRPQCDAVKGDQAVRTSNLVLSFRTRYGIFAKEPENGTRREKKRKITFEFQMAHEIYSRRNQHQAATRTRVDRLLNRFSIAMLTISFRAAFSYIKVHLGSRSGCF